MSTIEKRVRPSTQVRQAEVVKLILSGLSQYDVAERLGCSETTVRYHKQGWLEQQKPSSEQTEELRQHQAAQLDDLYARLWPRLDSDDYLLVTDRLVKLMDRKARLMGLDLQAGGLHVTVSREGLAAILGLDAPLVVDVEASEITEEGGA